MRASPSRGARACDRETGLCAETLLGDDIGGGFDERVGRNDHQFR